MAEQPNVTEPVVSKPKSTTPVFYSIPDTASAVQPVGCLGSYTTG